MFMYGDIAVMTEIIEILVCAFEQRVSGHFRVATRYPTRSHTYPAHGHVDDVQHSPLIRTLIYTRSSRLPT